MTHDSIGLGEDGPTHQPVEHLQSLRLIPNLDVYRPADAVETAECWAPALANEGPTLLALTRQNLPPVRTEAASENLSRARRLPPQGRRGRAQGHPDRHRLRSRDRARRRRARSKTQGIGADVVSMPCDRAVRRAGRGLSRGHPARRVEPRDPARVDRGRDDHRLGALHRASRPAHRHRPLRRVGARRPTCSSISASPRRSPIACPSIMEKVEHA